MARGELTLGATVVSVTGIVTLTTDFGARDSYVAQLKGVLLACCEAVRVLDLAHEIAHILLKHVETNSVLVDFDRDQLAMHDDEEESQADEFALEVLTGQPRPTILPSDDRYSARELARVALEAGPDLRIEPGTLALCFGYSTGDWATANAAIRQIYESPKPVSKEINSLARSQLVAGKIPDDYTSFLTAVLEEPRLT